MGGIWKNLQEMLEGLKGINFAVIWISGSNGCGKVMVAGSNGLREVMRGWSWYALNYLQHEFNKVILLVH